MKQATNLYLDSALVRAMKKHCEKKSLKHSAYVTGLLKKDLGTQYLEEQKKDKKI